MMMGSSAGARIYISFFDDVDPLLQAGMSKLVVPVARVQGGWHRPETSS